VVTLVLAVALGLGLGVVTGMPLGVINVAIVDASAAGHKKLATGIGIGGALADAIHAALAFIGIGQLVTRRPDLVRWLAIGAAALIVVYALLAWRRERKPTIVDASNARAIATGFVLTLPNPGALSAWVAVAATLWPRATIAEALTLAAGVGIGSATWFALLAHWVSRIPREHWSLRVIPKIALGALVAIAAVGVVRVL
jgi:threonine/homoserine/homoserine lactone efflux protein